MDNYSEKIRRDASELATGMIVHGAISLQRLAMVQIAKALWTSDGILDKWIEIITENTDGFDDYYPKKCYQLTRKIIERFHSLGSTPIFQNMIIPPLPLYMENRFISIIEEMGEQFVAFIVSMEQKAYKRNMIVDTCTIRSYFSNLQWTYLGRIDYRRTMRAVIEEGTLDDKTEFTEICTNCFEDKIDEWFKKPGENRVIDAVNILLGCGLMGILTDGRILLMLNWISHFGNRNLPCNMVEFEECGIPDYLINMLQRRNLKNVDMFVACADNGYLLGVEYFWPLMDENSRTRGFTHSMLTMAPKLPMIFYGSHMDIVVFLLQRMSPERWCKLLIAIEEGKISPLIMVSLLTRLWEDCSFPDLSILKKYIPWRLNGHQKPRGQIFDVLSELLSGEHGFPTREQRIRQFAFDILNSYSAIIRENKYFSKNSIMYVGLQTLTINRLLSISDISLIKALINHEAMQDSRESFLSSAAASFSSVSSRDMKKLNPKIREEFEKNILLNQDERALFQSMIDNINLSTP